MDECVPIHELKRQQREHQSRMRMGNNLGDYVHIRNNRMVVGNEVKNTIIRFRNLPFSVRAQINYINSQKIFGSMTAHIADN